MERDIRQQMETQTNNKNSNAANTHSTRVRTANQPLLPNLLREQLTINAAPIRPGTQHNNLDKHHPTELHGNQQEHPNRPRHALRAHANRSPSPHNGHMQCRPHQTCPRGQETHRSWTQSETRESLYCRGRFHQRRVSPLQFARHCLLRHLLLFQLCEGLVFAFGKLSVQFVLRLRLSFQLYVHHGTILDRFGLQSAFSE